MSIVRPRRFHEKQYEGQGYTVLLGASATTFISLMLQTVEEAQLGQLVDGDDSDHSWKEITLEPPIPLFDILPGIDIPAILGASPFSMRHWLNVYERGNFIDTHVDAGGDIQLLIPIELPPDGQGGTFWVEEKEKTIPVGVGDVVIFAAHRLRHGTTPVEAGRRISFNGRIWLS